MNETLFHDADMQISKKESGEKLLVPAADAKDRLGKRAHDLISAVRVVRFAVEALEAGQKFDGKDGESKIKSIARAASTLEKELPWIETLLDPNL